VPVLLGLPLVLLPVHIVFLELVIDPACSIAFEAEPEEQDVMSRPPRAPTARLFDRRTTTVAVLQGVLALAVVLVALDVAVQRGNDADGARAVAFSTLILANLALILANRSWSRTAVAMLCVPNRALWSILGGAVVMLALAWFVAPVRAVLRFDAPSLFDVALPVALGALALAGFDLVKRLA